jgi:hypothetical protein
MDINEKMRKLRAIKHNRSLMELIDALECGEMFIEDLGLDVIDRIKKTLFKQEDTHPAIDNDNRL